MAETPETPSVKEGDPIALAELVSQRVQIRSILLAESHVKRLPVAVPIGKGHRPIIEIPDVGFGRPPESKLLVVVPRFSLQVSKPKEAAAVEAADESYLTIEATFVLTYSVDSFDGLQDENLQAFATTNGIYNAWPYWREYVQNTISRMGLPPITVPVYRFQGTRTSIGPE